MSRRGVAAAVELRSKSERGRVTAASRRRPIGRNFRLAGSALLILATLLPSALALQPPSPIPSRRGVLLSTTLAVADGGLGSRIDELKTLGARAEQSGRTYQPEFWPGRVQGTPPPKPAVVLKDAPRIVVFPGFGNDRVDYLAPNELPEEVGLVAALSRRGVHASVVPIERSNWLGVAKGLGDPRFLMGDAQPEGAAFAWYLTKAKRTVEEAVAASSGQRIVILGHSAGGWLARALCVVAGDEWSSRYVRGIVTLGAPHASPPAGVADQTRGTRPNVNVRAPGAYLSSRNVFYVTVSSTRVHAYSC
jgi:pimeloyl-ACP methyl ester carboxylesterase